MKVKITVFREIEVDIDSKALETLDTLYRTTPNEEWKDIDNELVWKACGDVEKATGMRFYDDTRLDGEEVMTAVYAMDGEVIIEW